MSASMAAAMENSTPLPLKRPRAAAAAHCCNRRQAVTPTDPHGAAAFVAEKQSDGGMRAVETVQERASGSCGPHDSFDLSRRQVPRHRLGDEELRVCIWSHEWARTGRCPARRGRVGVIAIRRGRQRAVVGLADR